MSFESLGRTGRTVVKTVAAGALALSCAHAPTPSSDKAKDPDAPRFSSPAELCARAIEAINGFVARGLVRVGQAAGLPPNQKDARGDFLAKDLECDLARNDLEDAQGAARAAAVACDDPAAGEGGKQAHDAAKGRLDYLGKTLEATCGKGL